MTEFHKPIEPEPGCDGMAKAILVRMKGQTRTGKGEFMKSVAAAILSFTLAVPAFAQAGSAAQEMVVTRAGSQPSGKGPTQNFTGSVRVDPLFGAHASSTTSAGLVTFEPGARSAWHTHPAGQVLIVTAGVGRVQQWGRPVQEIRPGDVIWTPPGVKHWHGAAPTTAVTHIAIQDAVGGKNVEWLEKVSDEQYAK
jgi:quercetin dioxygenase-like cupin family protein